MRKWLTRNSGPIALVLLAAATVIGASELLDLAVESSPAADETGDVEMEGIASVAGLIKVTLFLGVGALLALPLRRRFRSRE